LAEVLPLQLSMSAKLHLVKGLEAARPRLERGTETCYRYPGPEEIWEVSCRDDGPSMAAQREERPSRRPDRRRRAS
jgi:hypothetical protein